MRTSERLFFSNAPPTPEIYTLSLHDALPISQHFLPRQWPHLRRRAPARLTPRPFAARAANGRRSEEHTSELQSRFDLVCRLLLEKKKDAPPEERGSAHRGRAQHPTADRV